MKGPWEPPHPPSSGQSLWETSPREAWRPKTHRLRQESLARVFRRWKGLSRSQGNGPGSAQDVSGEFVGQLRVKSSHGPRGTWPIERASRRHVTVNPQLCPPEHVGRFFFFYPPLFLLRGLGHGVVLARGALALARVSGRRGEAAAVASQAGAGEGGAAVLRLAPPGVAGRDGRVTCPGAERLRLRVSGAGERGASGPGPDCGRALWLLCVGRRGREEDGALCPQQHPSLSAPEPGSRRCPNLRCGCLHRCHVAPRLAKEPDCATR